MKTLILAFLLLPSIALANTFNTLARTDVTHLQLLLNNLNMYILNNLDKFKESQKSSSEQIDLIKFRTTSSHGLLVETYGTAPVSEVTQEKCKAAISEFKTGILADDTFIYLFSAFSYHEIPVPEIRNFLAKATFVTTLSAKENKQLSVSCTI